MSERAVVWIVMLLGCILFWAAVLTTVADLGRKSMDAINEAIRHRSAASASLPRTAG